MVEEPEVSAGRALAQARIDVWESIEERAELEPGAMAVHEAGRPSGVDYALLLASVENFCARLAEAGVRPGDCVAVATRRGLPELVATLAALRLGASCAPLAADLPPGQIQRMLAAVSATVIAGTQARLAALGDASRGHRHVALPHSPGSVKGPPPAAAANPAADAFLLFDAEAPDPGQVLRISRGLLGRLVGDLDLTPSRARSRMLRHSAPNEAAGVLEALAPLVCGGTVEVLPQTALSPGLLADFVTRRTLTGLWLSAEEFRQVADFRPDALRGVHQVLVDDEAPASATAAVARACPELRITLCHTVTCGALPVSFRQAQVEPGFPQRRGAPLPLGTPPQGIKFAALDARRRPAAVDVEGELCLVADGVRLEATAAAAQGRATDRPPGPGPGLAVLRTGELARNRPDGGVEVTGRLDGRIRAQGSWVSPEYVAEVLRRHPEVRDARVVPAPGRRLVGGVVVRGPERDPSLASELATHTSWWLRAVAVPTHWALLAELPQLLDGAAMARAAMADDPVHRAAARAPGPSLAEPAQSPAGPRELAPPAEPGELEALVRGVWAQLLEHDEFGLDDGFFEIGGSSLLALRLRDRLRQELPGCHIAVQDIYRHQTVRQFAARLARR